MSEERPVDPKKPGDDPPRSESDARWTLGGLQFWSDVQLFRDWRIQQNALTKHCRLLDGKDRCHVTGAEQQCREELERIRKAEGLEPLGGKAALLLPGIIRTRHCMASLAERLEKEGFTVYMVSYASTRMTIEEHADNLHRIVAGLDDAEEINFVCHSMAGLVVRSMLARHPQTRVNRVVMLATPNQGALRADFWRKNPIYRFIMGPSGQQLVTGGITNDLPAPSRIEIGVIAGGKQNGRGYSWTLPGDDDGTVTVESTKLPGARDFLVTPSRHTFIMNSGKVHDYCVSFLKHGYFRSEAERQPIPKQ